jgi:hypothetical protein
MTNVGSELVLSINGELRRYRLFRRAYFYACTSYHQRGHSVCRNGLDVPMEAFDAAVLTAIERDVLRPQPSKR